MSLPEIKTFTREIGGKSCPSKRPSRRAGRRRCLVYGDLVMLCTATMARKPRPGIDFFPLTIDFEERMYAVGKIPGIFFRREGRPRRKRSSRAG